MKKLSLALMLAFAATFGQAQYVPQGMNYQAVARSHSGEVLANQQVSLKIDLFTGSTETPQVHYSEVHTARTNQLGLFTLIIGAGKTETGAFAKVPWSTEEVWVSISIKDKSQSQYAVISSSKLLAVPYAFHAGTAAELVNKNGVATAAKSDTGANRTTEEPWLTTGNPLGDSKSRLGSSDNSDLVMVTNNTERLRILADGKLRVNALANPTQESPRQVMVNANGELFSAFANQVDSSHTRITAGDNVMITGLGTSVSPFIVNAKMDSLNVSPLAQVIAAGNETTGGIIFNNDDNFIVAKPSNYDVDQKRGSFSMAVKEFPGVNGAGNRSNVVGSFWGYNTNPGGGQAIKGEASYRFAGETYYDVGNQKMMEFHLPEMHTNSGFGVRPFSMYIDRESGIGSANFQMHQFNFKKVNDANVDWMRMRNDAGNIRVEMQPEQGGTSYFEMTGRGSNGWGGFHDNKAFMVNGGNGFGFVTSVGNFSFNSTLEVEGSVFTKGVFANNNNPDPNSIAHSFQGNSANNRLMVVGDNTMAEKFYVTPGIVVSHLDILSFGNLAVGKSIHPLGATDLNIKFNTNGNNAKLNFISDAGNVLAGQVSTQGMYAKSIQTETPVGGQGAGKLKIGSVVSATITGVTSKYLQIEIDGVSYKIPLMD